MKIRISFLGYIFLNLAVAQSVPDRGIENWFRAAWEHSPDMQSARANIDYARATNQRATSVYYPNLVARYSFREYQQSPYSRTAGLSVEKNLFNGFGDFYTQKATSELVAAESFAAEGVKNSLSRAIAESLLNLALAAAKRVAYDEDAQILDRRLHEYQHRTQIGRSRDVDLIQTKIDRLKLEQNRAATEQDRTASQLQVLQLTGQKVTEPPIALSDLLVDLDRYHRTLADTSPRRLELQKRFSSREELVKGSRGTYWPTVNGVATYYPRKQSNTKNGDDWSLGLDFQWTLFEGFNGQGIIGQAQAQSVQASADLQKFEFADADLRQQLTASWAELVDERKILIEGEDLARRALKEQERDFRLGLVTVLEQSIANEQYLNFKIERLAIDQRMGFVLTQAIESGGIQGIRLP